MSTASSVADDLFRREGARLVASLAAHLGTHRLQLAEDVVQEALVRALQTDIQAQQRRRLTISMVSSAMRCGCA